MIRAAYERLLEAVLWIGVIASVIVVFIAALMYALAPWLIVGYLAFKFGQWLVP